MYQRKTLQANTRNKGKSTSTWESTPLSAYNPQLAEDLGGMSSTPIFWFPVDPASLDGKDKKSFDALVEKLGAVCISKVNPMDKVSFVKNTSDNREFISLVDTGRNRTKTQEVFTFSDGDYLLQYRQGLYFEKCS